AAPYFRSASPVATCPGSSGNKRPNRPSGRSGSLGRSLKSTWGSVVRVGICQSPEYTQRLPSIRSTTHRRRVIVYAVAVVVANWEPWISVALFAVVPYSLILPNPFCEKHRSHDVT